MKYVSLVPGVKSSVLGFGCAPILGRIDASTARRAIGCALDLGINHFDVAPSYGYGAAEGFVGRELQGRRESVVLATKFGIRATAASKLLSPFKSLVRGVLNYRRARAPVQVPPAVPKPSETLGLKPSDRFHARVPLSPEALTSSVEQSLRNLRTDYLDFLVLHEPLPLDQNDVFLRALGGLKTSGKVRGIGISFWWNEYSVHESVASLFDILQFNASVGMPAYGDVVRIRGTRPNILFRPLKGDGHPMMGENDRKAALTQLGVDFPSSVILCSMFNPKHIQANVEAIGSRR